jgi:predicted lactoylglutathione lyase
MDSKGDSAPKVECAIPILPVRDISRSLAFYTETLGFSVDWIGEEQLACSVSRDRCSIMLLQQEPWNGPAWVWIGLHDDLLFEDFRAKGVKVLQEPRNERWAYEMKFEDVDGNVLWLGTEPKGDTPFSD